MKTSEYSYVLPKELIAQEPIEPRDSSRLMSVNRENGVIENHVFTDLTHYLDPGDLLIVNNSKVIAARLYGKRIPSGGQIELLLIRQLAEGEWEVLAKPGNRLQEGARLIVGENETAVQGEVLLSTSLGSRIIKFESEKALQNTLKHHGQIPLPPYIQKPLSTPERYQTVYAQVDGSAAAPTAGLHFTEKLLEEIEKKGVQIVFLTLHVGLGTFQPIRTDNPTEHNIGVEYFSFPEESAKLIKDAKKSEKRIVCVGTTALRALEQVAITCGISENQQNLESLTQCEGWTDLFILPGFEFRLADALITNFHLPESTLLMLVSSFAGKELAEKAYATAIKERYRFYSFGDAMLIT